MFKQLLFIFRIGFKLRNQWIFRQRAAIKVLHPDNINQWSKKRPNRALIKGIQTEDNKKQQKQQTSKHRKVRTALKMARAIWVAAVGQQDNQVKEMNKQAQHKSLSCFNSYWPHSSQRDLDNRRINGRKTYREMQGRRRLRAFRIWYPVLTNSIKDATLTSRVYFGKPINKMVKKMKQSI